MSQTILYDGTFSGFLTAVFEVYEYKWANPIIKPAMQFETELFFEAHQVVTDTVKSKRVARALKNLLGPSGFHKLYCAFLSEIPTIENTLINGIRYAFSAETNIIYDYSNEDVLQISKIARKVGREKHRMEAFVRFQETKDHIYFANIEPDFNVLPLIKNHFESRYADQKWIIYDLKRSYGLFYNLEYTQSIHLEFDKNLSTTDAKSEWFSEEEMRHQVLWKDYFKSTNIEERINTTLHIKHVPKRYWKYLTEKQ